MAACGTAEDVTRSTPTLTLVDSVILAETDAAFLGTPGGFAAAEDGTFFVSDSHNFNVQQYAANGERLRSIGTHGEGPGEFPESPGALATDGDSLLLVLLPARRIQVIDYRSGVFRTRRSLASPWVHALAAKDGRVFFKLVDTERHTSVGALDLVTDTIVAGGPFPHPLGRSPVIDQTHLSSVIVEPFGTPDSIAVVMQSAGFVFIGAFEGGSYDSIAIPVVNRQGSRPDLLEKFIADPENAGADVYTPSTPWLLAHLSDDNLVYVANDVRLVGTRFEGRMFLSVIDPRRRRACPDVEVPTPAHSWSQAAIRNDTLMVLTQEVTGDDAVTLIRKYVVDTRGCRWIADNAQ